MVAPSEEVSVGAAGICRFSARYERYEGPEDVCFAIADGDSDDDDTCSSDDGSVHRSIKSCVVSSGNVSSIARPYLARLLSA